jgi:septal ring factor EnvC (AmiA/AmiB activator)
MGPLGLMNVLFSSKTLPELLTFDEYFQRMLRYDEELVDDYRVKIEDLAKSKEELQAQKKELVAVISQVKAQEKSLSSSRQERKALLDRVKGEKRLYRQALKELEVAASKLTTTLENLKKEIETASQEHIAEAKQPVLPSKRRPDEGTDFISQKGWLDPPVSGTVTTRFGKNTSEQFNITTFASGIDIRTSGGANVKAIYNGDVVFAGFLQGYGNLIIIDHGQQYFSLVARIAKLLKKEGESVTRGEVVGIMDETEGLLGEGLHFEIRRGTEPENPLHWINNAKLKIQATRRINR